MGNGDHPLIVKVVHTKFVPCILTQIIMGNDGLRVYWPRTEYACTLAAEAADSVEFAALVSFDPSNAKLGVNPETRHPL